MTQDRPDNNDGETFAGELSFLRARRSRDLAHVDLAVVGIPYDLGTTNRPGARFGPRAIREQSSLVGDYPWGVWPWDYDIRERHNVIDYGDICHFDSQPNTMMSKVEQAADTILDNNVSLLSLGGDHFISLPLLRAHARKYGPLALIHFDAHTDTWVSDIYDHGTMFYHALKEGIIDADHCVHVGIRTPNPDTHNVEIIDAIQLTQMPIDDVAAQIRKRVGTKAAYLTLDIDFLDPAFAPGTGTPVVGGPSVMTARHLLFGLQDLDIVGGDQVEVAPAYDPLGSITALAGATLAADILYLIGNARARRAS